MLSTRAHDAHLRPRLWSRTSYERPHFVTMSSRSSCPVMVGASKILHASPSMHVCGLLAPCGLSHCRLLQQAEQYLLNCRRASSRSSPRSSPPAGVGKHR